MRSRYIFSNKGYDSNELRRYYDRLQIKSVIAQRKMRRKPRPGLPRGFDKPMFRRRNNVERSFNWLKEFRVLRRDIRSWPVALCDSMRSLLDCAAA